MTTKPTYDDLIKENKTLNQKLNNSKSRIEYQNLFETNPLSLWEVDFSKIIILLNNLKSNDIKDYKVYFDNNTDFVKKCVKSMKVLNVNKATLDLFKYETKDDIINDYTAIFNKQTFESFKNHLVLLIEGADKFTDETDFVDTTGEIIYGIIEFSKINNFKNAILTIIDISDRKKNEQSLIDSQLKWKFAIEGNKDGLWDWNIITNEVFFSKQWIHMLGFSKHEISGNFEEWDKRLHPDDRKRVYKDINKHLKGGSVLYETEYRMLCKDNTYKWILDKGKIINYTSDNKPARMIGTHSDISIRKLAEKRLKESEEKLIESNNAKNKFFSIIAHDLKSPFNSMLGFSDLLNENYDDFDSEKKKIFFKIIHEGIHNTYKLLDNLLLWSQSQSGSISFKPEKINLFLLLNETKEIFCQSFENKSIILINTISEEINFNADKEMLSTIIRNLISNALKYTKKGGIVTLSANSQTDKKSQNYTEIIVKDTGIGISKDIQSKLFDISENTSTEGTENERGTGLGLLLCKEFIEKHDGEIWVKSLVGKGSSFHFTIPDKFH